MILVTGGCGYIGSHIVRQLTEAGEQVVVYDNLSQGSRDALLQGEELVVGDICDVDALEKVFAAHPFDTVIHLAALVNAAESNEKKAEYEKVNKEGSENIWQAAVKAGIRHFLYSSSAAVYGTPIDTAPLDESAPTVPTNTYGVTKLAAEQSLIHTVLAPANYLSFRFFNVGGAEEKGRLRQSRQSRAIMQRIFAVAARDDEKLTVSGHDYDTADGTVVRDFVHVEDIAFAFVLGLNYLRNGGTSEIINLGGGQPHTIGEVIREAEIVTGIKIPIVYGKRIPGDISYSLADIRKAEKILGWEPVHSLRLIVSDGWHAYEKRNS